MAEGKSNGNHGAAQRSDNGLKDVVEGIKELTNEVRKLRETIESSAKSTNVKDLKQRFERFGSNIIPKKVK